MYLNLGLIGKPLSHSLSPMLHSLFLVSAKLNGGYACFETEKKEDLPETFDMLKRYRFRGFNVTVPYKEETVNLMDRLDPLASELGAVNTVLMDDRGFTGYNTDVYGFSRTLSDSGLDLTGKKVLMLGCGGAAKAVLRCLRDFDNMRLTLLNRDTEKARNVLSFLNFDNADLYDYNYMSKKSDYDLVINATSAGLEDGSFMNMDNISCQAAVDLQYKQTLTPFLSCFENRGCLLIDGFSMLVHQAHKAFGIWTGVEAEFDMNDFKSTAGAVN
jgi:shikimate dehydrogenase